MHLLGVPPSVGIQVKSLVSEDAATKDQDMNELWFPVFFTAIIATVLSFVIYRFSRYGGIIGLMYGRRHETLGDVELPMRFGSGKLTLYRLEPDRLGAEQDYALELRTHAGTSWHSIPFRISREKARELIDLLNKAAR